MPYTISDLGILGGGKSSHAIAINDSGQVVGYASVDAGDKIFHAFIWDSGEMIDLHDTWPATTSYAFAVNIAPAVVGGTSPVSSLNATGDAFYCGQPLSNPVPKDLDLNRTSIARGINTSGHIVGHHMRQGEKLWRAIYWSSEAVSPVELAPLSDKYTGPQIVPKGFLPHELGGKASAISNKGRIVGRADIDQVGNFVGCLWTSHTDTNPHPLLAPPGYYQSYAWALNDHINQIVGIYGPKDEAKLWGRLVLNPVETGTRYACVWRGKSTKVGPKFVTDPLFPGDPPPLSFAWDLNDKGDIVGTFVDPKIDQNTDPNKGKRAFISTPYSGPQDLTGFIQNNPGWTLTMAHGINNHGQIVGEGTIGGQTHAFLLTLVGGKQPHVSAPLTP